MPELPPEVTLDEVKERARLAGLPIPANRLSLVRGVPGERAAADPRPRHRPSGRWSRR